GDMTSGNLRAERSPGHMAAMDDTDRQIVDALRADGRLSMRALAELVHISRASAYTRVSRLEREGVITGYAAVIDPVRAGYALSAYVYLDIAQRSWKTVRGQLLGMPEIDHVALVSGEHDILLRVRARGAAELAWLRASRRAARSRAAGPGGARGRRRARPRWRRRRRWPATRYT